MVTRYSLLAVACLAIAIAVTAVRPARTPGPLARDFEAYWSAGRTSNDGADPYGNAIWSAERGIPGVDSQRDEILPFIGPPHTLLLWRLIARLPYELAANAWWIVLSASLLALIVAILRASGAPATALSFFAAAALAISFAPISSDLALGQIALVAFAGAVLAVVFADRWLPAAVFAATFALAQPNLALGLISQLGRNRTSLAIVLGAALTYALGAVAAGWQWPFHYARTVAEHAIAERFVAIQFTPASIAFDLGATQPQAQLVELATAAIAVAAAIALAVAVRDSFARFAVFSALTPFIAGFFHEHDFVVAFAAALWSAIRTTGATRAIALFGTLLAGFDWLGLAQRQSGIAQSVLLEGALFAAFVALGERTELRRALPIAAVVAVVIAGAAYLALHNPVPVWPDLLAGFRAPPSAGIASVWLQEQRANGLLAAVPAWGALRSLSLLGCALLSYAIYRHPSYCRTP
ncbi:MAG TPA: glycosyltransferase family 87 protein [Candidatus Cybelea sp.]